MTALVFAPAPHNFYAFPLVVHWQAQYDTLACYFPDLRFGLLEGKPGQGGFTSMLQPPRPQGLQALKRDYHLGELSQWQAYLDFLATQEHHDETDLKAAIRGHLEPILPKQADREVLWSLAHHLEQMLFEQAADLKRLADQQQALEKIWADELGEETELAPLEATFNPSLAGGLPDLTLVRLRYKFWREILEPQLTPPWTVLVLETAAGENSPRYLWEAAREEGGELWRAEIALPDWRPGSGSAAHDLAALHLGVEFRKTLGELLQSLNNNPAEMEASRQNLLRFAEDRLWPASGLSRKQAVRLEVFGWLKEAGEVDLVAEPMVFLSPEG